MTYFLNGTRGFNSPPIITPSAECTPFHPHHLPRVPSCNRRHTTAELLVLALLNIAHDHFFPLEPDKEE